MCDEFRTRLFRPWNILDSRDKSKHIEAQEGGDGCRENAVIRNKQEQEESCYDILMIRGKADEAGSSEVRVSSSNLSERRSRIVSENSVEDSATSEFSAEEPTTRDVRPLNDHSSCTADRIRVPLIQEIAHPAFHPMYSCNSFRKVNLPQSSSFDSLMIGTSLPIQVGTVYPPWIDVRKAHLFNALQPSYGVQSNLNSETIDNAVQILQRQVKEPKKLRSKKFRCERCNVAFSNNGQLKGHIRIHTGERPFKCDVENCGKAFTRNEELTRHKRIHTGLRPHACLVCGKSFGRKDHLKKHMRTHENRDYRLSAATLGMFTPGHVLPPQGLLFPHYHFPT